MNIKELMEQKNQKVTEMETLLNSVKEEVRSFTEEEEKNFNALKEDIERLNATMQAFEDSRKLIDDKQKEKEGEKVNEEERALEIEQRDIEDFAKFIRNDILSERAGESNFSKGDNGVIVPTTIANKIIKTVYDMSPILGKATKYTTKGNLDIPVYGKGTNDADITVGYGSDFTELVEKAGKFTSITLKDHLIGALAKIGNSLVNNTDIDLVNIVINIIAEYINFFLEGQALNGSTDKIQGCKEIPASQTVTSAVASVISYDDLVRVKNKVKQAFRKGSIWIMSQNTQTVLETMKDENDRPLFVADTTGEFSGMIMGYPVYVSDNMVDIADEATPIIFGNFSGLALKTTKDLEIQILKEKYATQHATGIVAWLQADIRVEHYQKLSKLTIKKATASVQG